MRLHYLESRLRRLESAVFERRFTVQLNTGETVHMDLSAVMKGCTDVLKGVSSREAYAVELLKSANDEFAAKNIAMLKGITHPIDTSVYP